MLSGVNRAPRFAAVDTQRRYQMVANAIRERVLAGDLMAGDKLPAERDLSQQFEVSRPTIREALIALEIMGFVDIRAGAGVFVSAGTNTADAQEQVSGPGPFELLEMRRIVEGEIAALCAPTISAARIEELEYYNAALGGVDVGSDPSLDADQRFHQALALETENSALVDLVSSYWTERRFHPLYTRLYEQVEPGKVAGPVVDEHKLVIKALRARSPEAARRAMQRHIARVMRTLLDRWNAVGDSGDMLAESRQSAVLNRIPDEELGV